MNSSAIASSLSKKRSQPSASSYSSFTYSGSKIMWIYKPPGYDDNTNNYPLIVFFPGYGATDGPGNFVANVNRGPSQSEGLGEVLLHGDEPPGVLICIPQNLTSGVDYGSAEWDAALTYMATNYRVNTNRQYITGPSGGAIGCSTVMNTRSNCAAVIPVSGPTFNNSTNTWASYVGTGIGFWQHHGTSDGTFGLTIGGTLYFANGSFGGPNDLNPAPRTTYYYNVGHSSGVWSTQVYYRLERTDIPGTAKFDFVRWMKKFSLDKPEQATLFVENTEYSLDIVDYRESLTLVNALSSGGTKTSLLARLVIVKAVIDQGGLRYVVSANQGSTTVSQTGINDWDATFAATQGLTNIVDDTGGASTVGFVVTNQFASSVRDNLAGNNNAGRAKYKGFKLEYNLGGLVLNHSISNGLLTINNIPSGKKIDVIVHHHHITGDDDDHTISAESSISATMNSVTKTQYSEYNNAYYLSFTNVPESSGSATLAMHPVSTRDIIIQGFEILVHS